MFDLEGMRGLAPQYEQLYRVTCNALLFAAQEWASLLVRAPAEPRPARTPAAVVLPAAQR
jgi:hypothetical protein